MSRKQFLYGIHAVLNLLDRHPERVISIYIQKALDSRKLQAVIEASNAHDVQVRYLDRNKLDQFVDNQNHQGVVAECHVPAILGENDLSSFLDQAVETAFILILDGVQDPHNLGACFRSAVAAGVQMIIAPKDNAVGITPVVSKVASGAAEIIPYFQVTNLVRVMKSLQERGIWVYGADGEAEKTIYQTDLSGAIAIVLGAEGAGLRRLTRETCDGLMKIPMQPVIESLNVSVATGICLFEAVRQRY